MNYRVCQEFRLTKQVAIIFELILTPFEASILTNRDDYFWVDFDHFKTEHRF